MCVHACVCVMYSVFPILSWACVHEREKTKNQPQTLLRCLTSGQWLPFPPPQGGCGIVSELQTPQATRIFCTLGQLVPTWLKDSNIKGGLRLLPKGDQGNASEQPFPSLGAPATSKADSGQQTRPHQRPPSPGEGLCNPGPGYALPPP